jgi:hypothetical protein
MPRPRRAGRAAGRELFHDPTASPTYPRPGRRPQDAGAEVDRTVPPLLGGSPTTPSGGPRRPGPQDAQTSWPARGLRGGCHPVWCRLAEHDGACGWTSATSAGGPSRSAPRLAGRGSADVPVRFRRPRGLLPLPDPAAGRLAPRTRAFANVEDRGDLALVLAAASDALPRGRGAVLELAGEQGSCKTTLARVLRSVVDPCPCRCGGAPGRARLVIAASNGGRGLRQPERGKGLAQATPSVGSARAAGSAGGSAVHRPGRGAPRRPAAAAAHRHQRRGDRSDLLDRTLSVVLRPCPRSGAGPRPRSGRRSATRTRASSAGLLDAASAAHGQP